MGFTMLALTALPKDVLFFKRFAGNQRRILAEVLQGLPVFLLFKRFAGIPYHLNVDFA